MHIRRLEEQLGCALFVKQGRAARLTSEGERLIEFARRMMQVEAGAIAALSRKGLRGAVRLGIPDDYAEAFLAEFSPSSTAAIRWSRFPSSARIRSNSARWFTPARSKSRW